MCHRLLLASVLLLMGFNADAGMSRVHGASGGASPGCPPAAQSESIDASDAKPEGVPQATVRPTPPPAAVNDSAMPRPGLRWHSFLPGMMK